MPKHQQLLLFLCTHHLLRMHSHSHAAWIYQLLIQYHLVKSLYILIVQGVVLIIFIVTAFTPTLFCTIHFFAETDFLHQPAFPETNYFTNSVLHTSPFTLTRTYTNQLLPYLVFTRTNFYSNQLLHQPALVLTSFSQKQPGGRRNAEGY